MSTHNYPRISGRNKLPTVPMCCICGGVATWCVTIQVTWFRGEDEIRDVCDEHKQGLTPEVLVLADGQRKGGAR
jgi:hypothetical protein